MQVKIKVRGIEAVQSFLRAMPRGTLKVALAAFTKYIVGNEQRGLRHADPYKFASRAKAYGATGATFENGNPVPDGYFSAKQFRFVAAKTKGFTDIGRKPPVKNVAAWKFTETKNGYGASISNDTTGGFFTRDDKRQARQLGNVGWRKVGAVIAANYLGAIRHAQAEVKKYLKSK
jgi:hypothetical protein